MSTKMIYVSDVSRGQKHYKRTCWYCLHFTQTKRSMVCSANHGKVVPIDYSFTQTCRKFSPAAEKDVP